MFFVEELFVGVSEGCEVGNQLGKGGAAGGCSCGHVVEVAVQRAHHFGRGGNGCGRDAIGFVRNCFDDATEWFGHVAAVAVRVMFGSAGLAEFGLPIRPLFLFGRVLFPYPRFYGVVVRYNECFDYDDMERFIGDRDIVGAAWLAPLPSG